MTKLEKFIKFMSPARKTKLDELLERGAKAYGWAGFFSGIIAFGIPYLILLVSPEIACLCLDPKHTPDQELTYQARIMITNRIYFVIFILLVLKLINQLSKKNREAHESKLRKDALMEIEIQERKAELENAKQHIKHQ